MLEDGGDTVAPPLRRRPATPATLLPPKPAFAKTSETSRLGTPADRAPTPDRTDVVDADAEEEADIDGPGVDTAFADEEADIDEAGVDADENDEADAEDRAVEQDEEQNAEGVDEEAAEEQDAEEHNPDGVDGEVGEDAEVLDAADANDAAAIVDHDDGHCDIRTPSPDNQGASRTEGGILRGRAKGNTFSFGDDEDHVEEPARAKIVGRVLVYESRLAGAEASFSMKQQVTPSLKDVLIRLGEKQSPIRSM
jgi:hypothetical protein